MTFGTWLNLQIIAEVAIGAMVKYSDLEARLLD